MSEEIKEKLDLFPNNMNDIAKEAYYQLENYITNLQKKYENAVADYELEKYKNIKALSWTNRIIEIIKQQPSEDDTWILDNLQSIKYLLQGSDRNE